MGATIGRKSEKWWKKGMPKTMLKFEAEQNRFANHLKSNMRQPWLHFWRCGGFGGRLETSLASLMPCSLTRSPPRRGAADVFCSKNDPLTLQGRLIWPFCLIFDGSKKRWSQLPAAIIRPGPAKIDVCENLALCKGRVPSISLQVLCGSGCVKSRKFREKQRKTWFFIRFSLKISERG